MFRHLYSQLLLRENYDDDDDDDTNKFWKLNVMHACVFVRLLVYFIN
jgi:hypothetical protein